MNFATFKEKAEDLYDSIIEDPKKRTIAIAVLSFLAGVVLGKFA